MKRAATGTNIRGSKPVTVYFQKYEDKEEILRYDKVRGAYVCGAVFF